jgi:LmbE family N-acetylglucosaminyl deacetylase
MQSEHPTDVASRRNSDRKPKRISFDPSSSILVTSDTEKHVARFAALKTEIRLLGEASTAWKVPGVSSWIKSEDSQGPTPIIKKRAARYRMPRKLKQDLLDRFVFSEGTGAPKPRVMIIAAHQDDETVGAGGRLCSLTDAWIVHVTDGAPNNPAVAQRYGFDSREAYAAARRQELHAALDVAGVLPEHRLCLNYVDGEASLRMVDLVLRLTDLIDNIEPDAIITHPYEGGHTDHDATAFAVHLACGLLRREGVKPPAVLEMTSYFRREGRRVVHDFLPHKRADLGMRVVELDQEMQERKRQMYDCFTSQQGIIQTFSTEFEKFRPAPRYVFTTPPHEGELNYERFGDPFRGERWRRNAEEALAKLRLRKSA